MDYNIISALENLTPGASWSLPRNPNANSEYERLVWHDENIQKPTEEEIVQKVAELKYQEEVSEYQRQRAREYPSMADQQDMQFHDAVNGTTTWKDTIQAVKDKYPKKKMNTRTLNKRKKDALAELEASRES